MRTLVFNLLLLTLVFSLAACGGSASEQSGDDMAQFVEEEGFKEAHDEPKAVPGERAGEIIQFEAADGEQASAYAIRHGEETNKYLFVIHEWWGLNDQIKHEADRLFGALDQVNVIALDMYDGKVADNRDDAGKYMQAMQEERGKAIIQGAISLAGADAQIATVGWCFGGGWSLKASIQAGEQGIGCVMYYGMPVQEAEALKSLQADVLGIFAEKDQWITPEVANNFKEMATDAGKQVEIHLFDADHAFANPSSDAYVEDAAQKANKLALEFLSKKFM